MRLTIGHWIVNESEELTQCPGYYAADWEKLRTRPGRYPVVLIFETGYTCPMPYWLVVKVGADRIDGRCYNGFGGMNFSSVQLPKEPKDYYIQTYVYTLPDLVKKGKVELIPGFEWALDALEFAKSKTWADIRALGGE